MNVKEVTPPATRAFEVTLTDQEMITLRRELHKLSERFDGHASIHAPNAWNLLVQLSAS